MNVSTSNINIDDEKLNRIEEGCQLFDKDNDGLITLSELRTVMRSLGNNIPDSDINEMLKLNDKDETALNTLVDYKDYFDLFIKTMSNLNEKEKEDEIIENYKKNYDRENTGMILVSELRHDINSCSEKFSEEEFEEIIRMVNKDNGNEIYYEDFVRVMFAK